jgi:hypothetical protein
MLALAIGCWLVGMILAQYFRIFALAPVALAACVPAAFIGVAQGHSFQSILLVCLLIVVCLQLGYLFGAWLALTGRLPMKKGRATRPDRAGGQ